MKNSFIAILFFYIGFHFILPEIYFLFFTQTPIYSDFIDPASSNKSFWINLIPILSVIVLINVFPFKNHKIQPIIKSPAATELFYFSILYSLFFLVEAGGFKGILSGKLSGALYNYINFFLNPMVLLMSALLLQVKKVNVIKMTLLYLIIVTISGSRSGIIGILILFLMGFGFDNINIYKNNLKKFLYFFLILSPLIFIFATQLRFGFSTIDWKLISNLIIGRVSYIESGMIPIYFHDVGISDLSLFYEKYGIINQLKLIIDSIFPGNIFIQDVLPNQYYREIFLGKSHWFIIENYQSMNMTLPVYFYLMFGLWGVPLTILFLFSFYLMLNKFKTNAYKSIILLSLLYPILSYFDWVMVFNQLFFTLLTLLTMYVYTKFRSILPKKNLQLPKYAD